tara:strand:- start:294 stop:428 length:135 start_codon:yes stop_codon:yes gene_type:complete
MSIIGGVLSLQLSRIKMPMNSRIHLKMILKIFDIDEKVGGGMFF